MKKHLTRVAGKLRLLYGTAERHESDLSSNRSEFLAPRRPRVALGLLIAVVCAINLIWIRQDQARMIKEDSYTFLWTLLNFVDFLDFQAFTHFWSSLGWLTVSGRPPVFQLLTVPFTFLFGRSEDAALCVNIVFIVILMIATYNIACLAKNSRAGLLAAFLVASYPPIIHLSRTYLPHFAMSACVALSFWLLLLLLEERTIKIAWLWGASLAFGLLIHPVFAWFLAVPAAVFGIYMLLFQTYPKKPVDLKHTPSWLWGKLRDPFSIRGLLPGALIALGLSLPWYLTWGLPLLHQLENAAPEGTSGFGVGFKDVEPSYWWYALTAPGAISNILTLFVVIGIIFAVTRLRLQTWFLVITLLASYSVLSLQTNKGWMYFLAALPIAACLSAVWVVGLRHKWLSNTLTVICVAVAAFNFSVVTWGVQPWSRSVAIALGSPMEDNKTCDVRISAVLCPSPAQADHWPAREIQQAILEDPECQQGRPCTLTIMHSYRGVWATRLIYLAKRDRLWDRLRIGIDRSGFAGPYNLHGLLKNDYLLYGDRKYPRHDSNYLSASVRFLQSPPAAFADAHETAATFEYPTGITAKLVKRIKPLTAVEAESSIAALELRDKYKIQRHVIMAELYALEGSLKKAMAQYDKISDTRSRESIRRILLKDSQSLGQPNERIIALYHETLEVNPNNVEARLRLAGSYAHIGKTEEAIAEFETAIALAPDNSAPRLMLADLYRSLEQIERVVVLYQELLEVDSNNLAIRLRLAEDYGRIGKPAEAIAELETAMALAPGSSVPRRRLAEVYRSLGQTERAIPLYQEALDIDPDDLNTRLRLANAFGSTGQLAEGVAELETAMAQWPDHVVPRLMLAHTYRSLGERDRAIAMYQQVLEIDPDNVQARQGLAALKV